MSDLAEEYVAQRKRFTDEITGWLDATYKDDEDLHVPAMASAFLQQALILFALSISEGFLK